MDSVRSQEVSNAYWNRRPCNSGHSILLPGTLAYFDEVRRRRYHVEDHIPEFAEFNKWGGQHVLDVGCGMGTDTTSFALSGARVTAVDPSAESCRLARESVTRYDVHDRVVIHNASAARKVVENESVDLAWSFGVLHHMTEEDMWTALQLMRTALKPGGTLKIMLYYKYSSKWLLCKLGLMQPEAQSGVPIVRAYSRSQARKLLQELGFVSVKTRVKHVFPYAIRPYKLGLYRRSWQWWLQPLQSVLGWHLLIEAKKPL